MALFDAEAFMNQTIDKPLETEFKICPAGEYEAMIGDFTSDAIESVDFEYKRGAKAGQPGTMVKFTCPFVINSEAVRKELNRDTVIVNKQIILDFDEDGGLDWGTNKNVDLGRIRQAVGQNTEGPWSVGKLRGAGPVMVKVTHREYQTREGRKGTNAEVERVVPIF